MKLAKTMAVFVAVLLLVGCGSQPDEVDFMLSADKKYDQATAQKLKDAAKVWQKSCPMLKKYVGDFERGQAIFRDAGNSSERRNLGWQNYVEIHLILKQEQKFIPAQFRAWGHHCYFRINGDDMTVGKKPCARVCKGENAVPDKFGRIISSR